MSAITDRATADLARATADKLALAELRYRYAAALDTQDWEAFRALFPAQVYVDYSKWGIPAAEMSGEAFTALMRHTFSKPGLRTQHFIANPLFTLEGDRARGGAYYTAHHFVGEHRLDVEGAYVEEYVREGDGSWRISAIHLDPRTVEGDAAEIFEM